MFERIGRFLDAGGVLLLIIVALALAYVWLAQVENGTEPLPDHPYHCTTSLYGVRCH